MASHRASPSRGDSFLGSLVASNSAVSYRLAHARLGRAALAGALSSGALLRVAHGTYVHADSWPLHITRCRAASLWLDGRGAVSGASALHLATDAIAGPRRVQVLIGPHDHIRAPAWIAVRHGPLPAGTHVARAVRCAPVAFSVVDAWRRLPTARGKDVVYRALWARVTSAEEIGHFARACTRLHGRGQLMGILVEFLAGATSPTEVMARREVFVGREWRDFAWQAPMLVAGRSRTIDMWHRGAALAVEFDGAAFHSSAEAVRNDRERDAEFAAAGIAVVRLSFADLALRPAWCRRVVASAVRHRLLRT